MLKEMAVAMKEHEVNSNLTAFWESKPRDPRAKAFTKLFEQKMLSAYDKIEELEKKLDSLPLKSDNASSASAENSTASMLDYFDPVNHIVYPAAFTYLSGLFFGFLFYLFSFLNLFFSLFVLRAIPFLCYGIYVFFYNKINEKL